MRLTNDAKRLLYRSAVRRWRMPFVAALSMVLMAVPSAVLAASVVFEARTFFMTVFTLDNQDRFLTA